MFTKDAHEKMEQQHFVRNGGVKYLSFYRRKIGMKEDDDA